MLRKHAEGHVCVIARSGICVYTLSAYLGSGIVLVLAALSHDGRISVQLWPIVIALSTPQSLGGRPWKPYGINTYLLHKLTSVI